MIQVRKVLYPTDFSTYSNQAYFHAVAQAEIHKASLTIVYVYSPGSADGGRPPEVARRYWREQLESISPTNPDIPVSHVFLEGDPADEIIRFARDAGIDLVVMGTHGRSGIDRMLMGSVAERVLRDGPCSTLVVKLPKGIPSPAKPDVEMTASR